MVEMIRDIFKYKVGGKSVCGDPVALNTRLTIACGGDWVKLAQQAFPNPAPTEDTALVFSKQAETRLIEAVRKAFGLLPYDVATGAGSLQAEVLEVFDAYTDFSLKKKNSTEPSLTSPQPTASDVPSPTTTSSSASG